MLEIHLKADDYKNRNVYSWLNLKENEVISKLGASTPDLS